MNKYIKAHELIRAFLNRQAEDGVIINTEHDGSTYKIREVHNLKGKVYFKYRYRDGDRLLSKLECLQVDSF